MSLDPVEHAGHASRAAGHGLGKQLGPFPVGVWLLVIAGGVGVAVLGSRKRASTAPTPLVNPAAIDNSLAPDNSVQPGADGPSYGYGYSDGFTAGFGLLGAGTDSPQPAVTPTPAGVSVSVPVAAAIPTRTVQEVAGVTQGGTTLWTAPHPADTPSWLSAFDNSGDGMNRATVGWRLDQAGNSVPIYSDVPGSGTPVAQQTPTPVQA